MSNIKIGDKVFNGVDTVKLKNADVEGEYIPFITPTGTKEITENGAVDVTQFASAQVSVPGITEITSASEMNALLVEANVGKVYRFMGTTDSTYTNGDLYEVVKG